jgi:hypothetical protein
MGIGVSSQCGTGRVEEIERKPTVVSHLFGSTPVGRFRPIPATQTRREIFPIADL